MAGGAGFSPRERAALAWCEELTLLAATGASDAVYQQVAAVFSPEDMVALTLAIVAINGWNRFAVGLRAPVGGYKPRPQPAAPERSSEPGGSVAADRTEAEAGQ